MNRISGLDLARFFAFIGMALVNFKHGDGVYWRPITDMDEHF